MRCYEIRASSIGENGYPGIRTAAAPDGGRYIALGEEGRGRRLTRIPLAPELAALEEIERASAFRRSDGSIYLGPETRPDDRRALAAIRIDGGYRGEAIWTHPERDPAYAEPCPNQGHYWQADEIGETCPICGAGMPAYMDDYFRRLTRHHPREGTRPGYPPIPGPDRPGALWTLPGLTIIAEGWRAQGEAGRMGCHPERLCILEPGTAIRIERTGRTYGRPWELWIRWTGEQMLLGDRSILASPEALTQGGEEI